MSEMEVRSGRRTVRLTRLRQRWWPELGITKRDVVEYYRAIAPVLLPHLRGRPFTFRRHYNGPRSPFEWVKDAPPEAPPWLRVAPLPARSRGGELVRYAVLDDEPSLLWAIEFGAVDLHVTTARADRPDRPDFALFDLDPAGVPFSAVVEAALAVREALAALGLEALVRTTGGAGLHVHVPLARRHDHDEARRFCDVVAVAVASTSGGLVTTERSPRRRHGVYVDCKMNGRAQQIVCVYSLRPLPSAAVSTPLRWEELTPELDPTAFTTDVVLERAARHGDLFAAVLRGGQRLDQALARVSSASVGTPGG